MHTVAAESPTQTAERRRGLTVREVEERRREYGENLLPSARGPTTWSILLAQFASPLVYIILGAAVVSLILGETTDSAIIMAVVLIDVAVGFVQEYQAQRTYSALRGLLRPTTTVIRDGERQEVEVREVVPGDLVLLSSGDRIPADGDVIESARLSVNEAILTGESEPVAKQAAPARNQTFMGTTIVAGRGLMVVTATGSATELGRIAASIQKREEQATPLQVRLGAFSRTLTMLVIAVSTAILVIGVAFGRGPLQMLRVSIILAIAAVPEGLLIAVTVILVIGQRRILQRHGLVRRLLAAETLGSVTVICTDKTGTLTQGRMQVVRSDLADRRRALEAMVLANDLEGPLEVALWTYARQELDVDPQTLYNRAERLEEEPFSSEAKFMITANRLDGEESDYLKGAPEIVLGMCRISTAEREHVLSLVDEWAGEGLRTLGLAQRPRGPLDDRSGYKWAGLVAMQDPIRPDVPAAISEARQAGIRVKMITGDYRRTAEQVAHGVGLEAAAGQVVDGEELARLDEAGLAARVEESDIFARVRPEDKLRIVRALQANGEVVAMIGDGVNDAPALRQANIGVVVGTGTDVAETAGLILLDNSFATVVAAIEEGRIIFDNIRKVVSYTLSNSFAEVLVIFGAILLNFPAPLTVGQILWIHLICDGPPDIVLGFEPAEPGIMRQAPRPLAEPILDSLGLTLIGVISLLSALLALVLFTNYWGATGNISLAQTFAYATLAINSLIYIFAYRSLRRSIFRMPSPLQNRPLLAAVAAGLVVATAAVLLPSLRNLLRLHPLEPVQWAIIFSVGVALLAIVETVKYLSRRLVGTWGG